MSERLNIEIAEMQSRLSGSQPFSTVSDQSRLSVSSAASSITSSGLKRADDSIRIDYGAAIPDADGTPKPLIITVEMIRNPKLRISMKLRLYV
jgi:hypothetical protein